MLQGRNEQEWFPVLKIGRLTHRCDPIHHSTYTDKPPDEPAALGLALHEVFVPILHKQFPEIVDFCLLPEGCSYRMAVVSIRKSYPGHAKGLMFGVWSFLRQFMYTKFIIVTDEWTQSLRSRGPGPSTSRVPNGWHLPPAPPTVKAGRRLFSRVASYPFCHRLFEGCTCPRRSSVGVDVF